MKTQELEVRTGTPQDLPAIFRIQTDSPQAAQWEPAGYLDYDFRVAICAGEVAGFAVARAVAGEVELLNLAVAPEFRRQGVATMLMRDLRQRHTGPVYLEVRESNAGALSFYRGIGFEVAGRRPEYYEEPREGAVVMKLRSCYCHR